jgi:hypothetical protein
MGQRYHHPNYRGWQQRNRQSRKRTNFAWEVITASAIVGAASFIAAPSIEHYWWYYQAPPAEIAARESSVYYAGCDQARAAGAAPIERGEPGYREGMDGDNDGTACESYP